MKSKEIQSSSFLRAQKRVEEIKGFYKHLTAFIIVNAILLIAKEKVHFMILDSEALVNPGFLDWVNWNVYGTPIVWGIGLGIHAIVVFAFGKAWEERQLKKIMEENKVQNRWN